MTTVAPSDSPQNAHPITQPNTPLNLGADPIAAFLEWFKAAEKYQSKAVNYDPTAMTLSTLTARGRPAARIVLYKGIVRGGLMFVTNYESRKGQELSKNPAAGLVFHWPELRRQVRFEGAVERLTAKESDEYFHSRPRGSQVGAWASPQSREIQSRDELLKNLQAAEERFKGRDVERPPHWGGFIVKPDVVEFWEEREHRLHERLRYELNGASWKMNRLAP